MIIFTAAFLVAPMRGHALFRHLVHFSGADLHLHVFAAGPDDRSVQGLIAVILGAGDVIVELTGNGRPAAVDKAQHRVAFGHRIHDDAEAMHIVDFFEGDALALHFAPDGVNVLGSAADIGFDPGLVKLPPYLPLHQSDESFPGFTPLRQRCLQLLIDFGVQIAKRKVF